MWSLSRKIPCSSNENEVRFLVGKEYIVGRKDCAVLIKEDPSISRKHAVLTVQYDIANLGDISFVPELTLTDSSKYGTSVNGIKITQPTKLKNSDEVLFGTHSSVFRVCYSPLVAVTSCLENSKKKLLKKHIHSLGGHLANEWKPGQVTHLVMDGLVFTIKVIHALAECCSIVTPSWFDETLKAMETKQALPPPKMFLPPLKEDSIKSDEPLFLPDQKRKTLFTGKTFYFLSNKQFKRTHEAIKMCSGKTVLLELSSDLQYDQRLVKDGCCLMMIDQKERESLSMSNKEYITQIMDFLRSKKKRPIPESELGLAILQMTQANYCNPNIDAVPAITQNIVCQSLNVGLDEMSQIYSPQHKQHTAQFKRPSTASNSKDESKPVLQSGSRDVGKTMQSTITSTFTPERSTKHTKEDERKISATDTPENAMKSDKPKEILKVSPIPDTMNISDEGNVFVSETPAKHPSKSTITSYFTADKNGKNVIPDSLSPDKNKLELEISRKEACKMTTVQVKMGKELVPDSLSFDISDFESKSISKITDKRVKKDASFQKDGKQSTVVPDTLRFSSSESELDPKILSKEYDSRALFSPSVTSKGNKKFEGVIPDSLGIDSETNDFNTGQISSRKESRSEQVIADSMDIDSETTRSKRRRMTEDEKDLEVEYKTLPVKRMKNSAEDEEKDEVSSLDGLQTKQSKKEGNSKESSDTEKTAGGKVLPELGARKALPEGFLSTRVLGKANLTEVKKPMKADDTIKESEFNEDNLPRNLVVVDVVSLVVRNPRGKKTTRTTEVTGKNFKKFRKQWYAGCDRRFPKIIGGSDLVVHHALSNVEHEDWFVEAREASQEQERRDRMEEQLFMSDAGLPTRRKKLQKKNM